jgi:hypothetical protein
MNVYKYYERFGINQFEHEHWVLYRTRDVPDPDTGNI